MKTTIRSQQSRDTNPKSGHGFTLIELLVVIALMVLPLSAAEPRPGTVDLSFAAREIPTDCAPAGNASIVEDIVLAPDGRIYIGGHFCSVQGVPRDAVARLNPDGSLDLSFESVVPLGGDTHRVVLQTDGSIVAGSDHSHRINSDGTPDESFPTNLQIIAQQSDGKLLGFAMGDNQGRLKRFLPDGKTDPQFVNAYQPYGPDRWPILLQRDWKLLFFHNDRARFSRFNADGTVDPSFTSVTASISSSGEVVAAVMAIQDDGKILLAGSFDRVNGISAGVVARLNPDGSLDTSFTAPAGLSFSRFRRDPSIAVQPDGRVLFGGDAGLIRLNPDGSLDRTFAEVNDMGIKPLSVNRIVLQPDGRILAAGIFETIDGSQFHGIVRFHGDSPILRLGFPQRLTDGTIQLTVFDLPDRATVVEAATVLSPPDWHTIWTNTLSSGSFTVTDADASTSPHRYYRALAR